MRRHPWRLKGVSAVGIAVVAGALIGVFGVLPVRSQTLVLDASLTQEEIPLDDPWDDIWNSAAPQSVPLSAQNVVPPFGGGTVSALIARALHDGDRLYLLLEWADGAVDNAVNTNISFSDAAAVQFPGETDAVVPYTMGGPDLPVNIWQWKAVWETDIAEGFSASRYPNTYSDDYPNAGDPLYAPALDLGNPLSQADHASPVENLIAEGFGTLTHVEVQDVEGVGEWREGRWRTLFARDFAPSTDGLASFAVGEDTMVAFAVWDGGGGDRNGQKSIAQFVDLRLSGETTAIGDGIVADEDDGGIAGLGTFIAFFLLLGGIVVIYLLAFGLRTKPTDGED